MPLKTKHFDAADPLTSPELIDGYLDEAIATGNPAVIRLALSVVARARRRLAVRRRPGLSDQQPTLVVTSTAFTCSERSAPAAALRIRPGAIAPRRGLSG